MSKNARSPQSNPTDTTVAPSQSSSTVDTQGALAHPTSPTANNKQVDNLNPEKVN